MGVTKPPSGCETPETHAEAVLQHVELHLLVVLLVRSEVLRASENSPSSMPSPTYHCTNARFEYIRSNLWSARAVSAAAASSTGTLAEVVPGARDRGRVREHAQAAARLGEVAAGQERARLVADAELEAGRAPVEELDRPLCLDARDRRRCLLRHNVAAVEQAARHYNMRQR
jgi:hypothetical protein